MLRPGGEPDRDEPLRRVRAAFALASSAEMETAAAWLGWHPNFPYSRGRKLDQIRARRSIVERSELAPMKLFTLIRIEKVGQRGTV